MLLPVCNGLALREKCAAQRRASEIFHKTARYIIAGINDHLKRRTDMTNWCISVSSVKPGWDKVAKLMDKDNNNELCYSEAPRGIPEHEFKNFLDSIKKDPPRPRLGSLHLFRGKSKNLNRQGLKKLEQIAAAFKKDPRYKNARLIVECHTDSTGNYQKNLKLSQERANKVRDRIFLKGIPGAKIEAVGHGPNKPVASNKSAAGRASNNRTEFIIFVDTVYKR
jgi:outer membrane protein OmpA-like peptidoglycan-associated protein